MPPTRTNSDSRSHQWHAWLSAFRARPKPPPVSRHELPHNEQLNVQQLHDRLLQNLDAQNPLLQRLRAIDAELAELDPCPDTSFLKPTSFSSKEDYDHALKAQVKAVCAFLPPIDLRKLPDYNFLWQLRCLARRLAPLYVQICSTGWRDREEFRRLFCQILTLWDDVPYFQADGTRVPAALRHSVSINLISSSQFFGTKPAADGHQVFPRGRPLFQKKAALRPPKASPSSKLESALEPCTSSKAQGELSPLFSSHL